MTSTEDPFRKYFDPRTIAGVEGLELKARRIVEGLVSGLHRSPYRGSSVEFAEHREYSPGDDLRYLDWKVFGKTDRYYLKSYAEESNLACYIVIDHSESMRYRSDPESCTKLEYAKLLAACLSYIVVRQQDAIGLFTVSDSVSAAVSPSNQATQLRSIVQVLDATTANGSTNLPAATQDLVGRIPRRSIVVVISDLLVELESIQKMFAHLQSRKHDVAVLQVLDPAELDFPFEEPMLFRGLETGDIETGDPRAIRAEYLKEIEEFLGQVERGCRQSGFDYLSARTDHSPEAVLRRFLADRRRTG